MRRYVGYSHPDQTSDAGDQTAPATFSTGRVASDLVSRGAWMDMTVYGATTQRPEPLEFPVLALILFLIIVWIILGIIGVVVHGLFWLLIIAAILFLATLVFGGSRLRGGKR